MASHTASVQVFGAMKIFKGFIDKWGLDEKNIQTTVVNMFARWTQRTLSRYPNSLTISIKL